MIETFKNLLQKSFQPVMETTVAEAYDDWSSSYDEQPGNLMLDLDEIIFTKLLNAVELKNKRIADIGCGTGRHWKKLYAANPFLLTGYDVSAGMLKILSQKYPLANAYKLENHKLEELQNDSVDVLISTLTIAHIKNAGEAIQEWNRVLKAGADVIITDYHPAALLRGARRTFRSGGKTVSIKNYIHTTDKIINAAKKLNWELIQLTERKIDEAVKHYYEQQNALATFKSFEGVPIIYGMHFRKA